MDLKMSDKNLRFIAGKGAFERIKGEGLKQESVSTLAGAAGGPKWLVLSGIDRALAAGFFRGRKEALRTIGSSIGCWRFAALAQEDPDKAFDLFEESYIHQRYKKGHGADEVTRQSLGILKKFLGEKGIESILSHNTYRMNIITVRCRWPVSSEEKAVLMPGLGTGFFLNLLHRKLNSILFERTIFHDPREDPPLKSSFTGAVNVSLSEGNLIPSLMATASIPLVMEGVVNPEGAPPGVYRDGGVVDYHLDLPFSDQGLVLYPHFIPDIIPGWFDKGTGWRKGSELNMDNVLIVSPSESFKEKLPLMKIPDRKDFILFRGRDDERIACWKKVVELNRLLGEEFMEAVESGSVISRIEKYPAGK
jgi:hypothetical protein